MRNYFDAKLDKLVHVNSIYTNMLCDTEGWLLNNPLGIRTEREIHAEFEGARIYRRMYQKQRCIFASFSFFPPISIVLSYDHVFVYLQLIMLLVLFHEAQDFLVD